MSTMTQVLNDNTLKHGFDETRNHYVVVHPLDDMPEEKVNTETLGPMPMTTTVKWSLISLRGYLILMLMLVLLRVFQLAASAR